MLYALGNEVQITTPFAGKLALPPTLCLCIATNFLSTLQTKQIRSLSLPNKPSMGSWCSHRCRACNYTYCAYVVPHRHRLSCCMCPRHLRPSRMWLLRHIRSCSDIWHAMSQACLHCKCHSIASDTFSSSSPCTSARSTCTPLQSGLWL